MRKFIVMAAISAFGDIEYSASVRMEVRAASLSEAYKAVRKLPGFRHAYLSEG